jgi:hypothetical protein
MANTRTHIRSLCDYDLEFLGEIVEMLDRHLDRLDEEANGHPDPDGSGILDRMEYVSGLGLVACQNYLAAVIGTGDKTQCLALGPKHANHHSIAEIVNAGANYVKHRAEPLTSKSNINILDAFGVWKHDATYQGGKYDYPIGNLLYAALYPLRPRFKTLLTLLQQWRDAMITAGTAA